jgi:hypothetical protein
MSTGMGRQGLDRVKLGRTRALAVRFAFFVPFVLFEVSPVSVAQLAAGTGTGYAEHGGEAGWPTIGMDDDGLKGIVKA